MARRPRFASAAIILVLCLGFILQPAPSSPVSSWHLRWPKVHLGFDASSPAHAVASLTSDMGHAIVGGVRYLGTAFDAALRGVGDLFGSRPAHADVSSPSLSTDAVLIPPDTDA